MLAAELVLRTRADAYRRLEDTACCASKVLTAPGLHVVACMSWVAQTLFTALRLHSARMPRAGAAEARADEDAAGLAALSCAPSGGVLSVAASALLDADFGRICTRPGTSCARPSCERRSAPRAAGEAAALPADGVAASRGGWVDPGRALSSDGTCVAAQAAAAAEAAWAATGGGAVAGRLTRGERLHAAARMAYLEHIREGAGAPAEASQMSEHAVACPVCVQPHAWRSSGVDGSRGCRIPHAEPLQRACSQS